MMFFVLIIYCTCRRYQLYLFCTQYFSHKNNKKKNYFFFIIIIRYGQVRLYNIIVIFNNCRSITHQCLALHARVCVNKQTTRSGVPRVCLTLDKTEKKRKKKKQQERKIRKNDVYVEGQVIYDITYITTLATSSIEWSDILFIYLRSVFTLHRRSEYFKL